MTQADPAGLTAQAEAIFNAALMLNADEQSTYISAACGENLILRQRVEALLRAHTAAERFLPETPAATPPGWTVAGRVIGDYELIEEIARGGMGVVYRARQRSLGRTVALKMLPLAQFSSAGSMQRFRSEAATAAALQHPNIVAIHEVGNHEGQPYYSMDLIEGRNLDELVRDKPLSARNAAGLIKILAEAVHYAHGRDILHRDLKPSNVLMDPFGRPHITDFGLATKVKSESDLNGEHPLPADDSNASRVAILSSTLTLPDQIVGSPNYMPPEQASSQRGAIGPPSDVYSLGAILFHLLTGRPPFQAETIEETLLQLLNTEPPGLRLLNASVPRDLETICLKCLAKDCSRRYATAQDLADDLGRFLKGEPIQARRAGPLRRITRWCGRHPIPAAAVAGLVVVAVASAWTAIHLQRLNREIRLNLYVQDMNVALRSWQEGNRAQAFELLKRHIPEGGEPDLRAFEWRYLWKLCRGDYFQWLPKHKQVVGTMQFSPDGARLATCAWDGTLRIWQRDTRSNLVTTTEVSSLGGFTEDGRSVLVGRRDASLQFLDAQTGFTNQALPNAGELVGFAPGAQLIVVVTRDDVLRVLRLSGSSPRLSVPGVARRKLDFGWSDPITISADGRWLALIQASANALRPDLAIRLWDLEMGRELPSLQENRQVRCLEFSPDGTVLAVGDGNGVVKLWKIATRDFIRISAHERPVLSLAFSPDSHLLATGSADQYGIRLWKVRDGEPVPRIFSGQVGDVWSLAFSPDARLLAGGSRDSPIRIWDLEHSVIGETVPERLHADDYGNFCFSPDGRLMAGGCADNQVRVWEVTTLNIRGILRNATYVAAFSRDGRELLVSTKDGVPKWWNFESQTTRPIPGYSGKLAHVTAVDLSPDRKVAALGLANGEIQLLEIDSGRLIGQPLSGHQGAVRSLAFSPGGDKLASGGSDKTVMIWDVHSQKGLGMCLEHKGGVFGVAISSNGQLLASGCGAETIKFWMMANVSTGSVASISYHSSAIRTLAFSVDERTLASGSEDYTVKLWNIALRREVASFKYEAHVRLVSFSPDGNTLAVITDTGALRILRTASLEEAQADWRNFLR
jgi:WD40 repeat protein